MIENNPGNIKHKGALPTDPINDIAIAHWSLNNIPKVIIKITISNLIIFFKIYLILDYYIQLKKNNYNILWTGTIPKT